MGARREILTFPGTTPNADGSANQIAKRMVAVHCLGLTYQHPAGFTVTGDLNVGSGDFFVDDSAGRVGIGTTSPSYDLHVVGSGYFTDDLRVGNTTPSKITLNGNDAFVEGQFEAAGTAGSYIYSLALGTSNPSSTSGAISTSGAVSAASASFTGQMTAGNTSVASYQVVGTTTAITLDGNAINGSNTTKVREAKETHMHSAAATSSLVA